MFSRADNRELLLGTHSSLTILSNTTVQRHRKLNFINEGYAPSFDTLNISIVNLTRFLKRIAIFKSAKIKCEMSSINRNKIVWNEQSVSLNTCVVLLMFWIN